MTTDSGFVWTVDTLTPRLKALPVLVDRGIVAIFKREEAIAEGEMRNNAPWTDRSGNARSGLGATSDKDGPVYTLTLYHSVPYGIYLEVKNQGEYAAVVPQIEKSGDHIMAQIAGLMSKLGGTAGAIG